MTAFHLFIDTETAPSHDPAVLAEIDAKHVVPPLDTSSIRAASNLVDQAKIDADLSKKLDRAVADHEADKLKAKAVAEAEYGRTNLDGATAHLSAFAFALNNREISQGGNQAFRSFPTFAPDLEDVLKGERDLLSNTFRLIGAEIELERIDRAKAKLLECGLEQTPEAIRREKTIQPRIPVVVAHSADFDIRMIYQRSVVLGVEIPDWWPIDHHKYKQDQVIDTMSPWSGVGNRVSLDRLCRVLGIPGKGDIDGAGVWAALQAGRYADVVEYCGDDVERLRQVFERLRRPDPRTFIRSMTETMAHRFGLDADDVDRIVGAAS